MHKPAPARSQRRSVLWALALVILSAGIMRLAHAWSSYGVFGPYFDPQEEYYESGVALGETGLFSPGADGVETKAWRGPLYPAFIALIDAGFSEPSTGHIAVAQALLSTAAVGAAAALAFLLGGPPAALFTAVFAAFDPAQILAVSSLNIHGFYGLMILALAAIAALASQAPALAASAGVGLSLAGTLLCRSSHLLAVPLLAIHAARRSGIKAAAAVVLWTALGLLPWTIRNYTRIGGFVPLDIGGGSYSLLMASQGHKGVTGISDGLELAESLRPGFRARHPPGAEAEDAVRVLAYEEIARRPGRYLANCLRSLLLFWKPLWFLALLAALAFIAGKPDPALIAVGCVAISFSTYAALAIYEHPYELGVAPVLDVLAGCGAAMILARLRSPAEETTLDARLATVARRVLRAWIGFLLVLTAGVQAWALVDASRGGYRSPAFTGPRVLSILKNGSLASGGRWWKSVSTEELRAKPLRNEGVRLFMAGRIAAAVEVFQAAVEVSPQGAADRLNLCVALDRLGRAQEALVQCDRAAVLARGRDPVLLASALSSRDSLLRQRRLADELRKQRRPHVRRDVQP